MYELKNYLPCFPGTGTPEVQPDKMDDDKIKEIAEYGIPYQWQQQMRVLNFNSTKKTVPEFIDFCKRLEYLEGPNDEAVASMTGIIKASGMFDDLNWYRAFDSGELKQIYEVASTKMTEYVSARSFVEND